MDGRVLYKKRGDDRSDSEIIEHFEMQGVVKWHIKPVSSKGKGSFHAVIDGGCALEACVDRVWKNQESMKMWTGAEAEAQASSLNARMHARNSPPALFPPSFAALVAPSHARS